jgi:hypothetical protein
VNSPSRKSCRRSRRTARASISRPTGPGRWRRGPLGLPAGRARDAPWEAAPQPRAVINTDFNERSPELSRDGHFLFFATNRPGGARRLRHLGVLAGPHARRLRLAAAVNLGSGVNSVAAISARASSRTTRSAMPILYFASTRPGGWAAPTSIAACAAGRRLRARDAGARAQQSAGDFRPSIRADGLEIAPSTRIAPDRPTSPGSVSRHLGGEPP